MNRWVTFNKYMMLGLQWMLLNIYWLIFTFLGGVILGFFPATIALLTMLANKSYKEQSARELFKSFWQVYKKHFLRGNRYAVIYYGIAYLIYWSSLTVLSNDLQILYPWLILLLIMFVAHLAYFFVFMATEHLSFWGHLSQPFMVMLVTPLETIGIVVTTVLWLIVLDFFVVLIPLFSANVIALCWLLLSQQALRKIKKKQEVMEG
ncbi:YesL family protein [Fundicoccus culcitae]|uniref:DUF624 domain-containing protein n=1 Tax=Fundicoccus culcitae TaxID=2969821 RepID=A0ABY5P5L7_9LACT|nr:DUF624 domain-containing protein [Fundicoccus culcitae]UUX33770.1 DUF624 domain-containing protein [Fundicoccus culcitae]